VPNAVHAVASNAGVVCVAEAVLLIVPLVAVTLAVRVAVPVPALPTLGNVNVTVVTPVLLFVLDAQVAPVGTTQFMAV